tara:strand:- start:828 stop:5621 length:4794 start_codon:yes stop_codon:yes gene_type:complete
MSRREHNYKKNSPPLTEKGQFKDTSLDQSVNPDWWKNKAQRDSSVLTSSDVGANTTRVQLHHNKTKEYRTTQTLDFDIVRTIKGGENLTDGTNLNYYKQKFNESDITQNEDPKDGIYANFDTGSQTNRVGEPYEDIERSEALVKFKIPKKRKIPMKAYDGIEKDTTGANKFYGQERLPFSIYSSSVTSGYQDQLKDMSLGMSVEGMHHDTHPATNEVPAQGPFTDRHVGGYKYRHNDLMETSVRDRAEGFRIAIDQTNDQISVHNPRFVGGEYDSDQPMGTFMRDESAKRPVNIRNIKNSGSVIGNYQQDYQIVLTNDRAINNRNFTSGGLPATTSVPSLVLGWDANNEVNEIALIDRDHTGSNKHIIVSRFVGYGGPEEESEIFLDFNSGQYSPYSTITYRNLVAKRALNELYSRHSSQFGIDSVYGTPWPSFHKVNRNSVLRPHRQFHSSSNKAEHVYDNKWVSHEIPRTEIQYKWINDSWIVQHDPTSLTYLVSNFGDVSNITSSDFLPLMGHQYSASLESIAFVSASEFVSTNGELGSDRFDDDPEVTNILPTDFVGLNYHIYEPITGSTLGHESETSIVTYYNEDVIGSISTLATASLLNVLLLNRNGPYGWPLWKQLRAGEHRVARFKRENNFFEAQNEMIDVNNDKVVRKITSFQQAPVSAKHKAVKHMFGDSILKHNFGNDHHYFGEVYDLENKRILNHNDKFGISNNTSETLLEFLKDDWRRVSYSEVVYPKDENVYKNKIRLRTDITSFWRDKIDDRDLPSIIGSQDQEFSGSQWPMDVHTSSVGGENSGELMRPDSCDLYNDGEFGPCIVPPDGEEINARFGRYYGTCRPQNLVHDAAGRGPFHDTYDKFAKDVRLIGQGYGLLPEFTMSDYVFTIGDEHGFDFYQNLYDISLPGGYLTPTELTESATLQDRDDRAAGKRRSPNQNEFIETFSHSDVVSNFDRVRDNYGDPKSVSLTFDGVMKLLPRKGFYPMQRTLDLATQFSKSYGEGEPEGTEASWRTVLTPFYSPGIMYNSIRSGIAVDYPIVDQETVELDITSALEDRTGGYIKRLPFEAIVEPEFYAKQVKGSGSGDFLKIYDFELEMPLDSTGTLQGKNLIYDRMSHNFVAEVPEFFLEKLTSVKSKPSKEWTFKGPLSSSSGIKKFVMDVIIEKTANFVHHDAAQWFGPYPHIYHVPPYYTLGEGNSWEVAQSAFACGTYDGFATNEANKAIARILFDPEQIKDKAPDRFINGKFTIEDIINYSTVTFTNQHMGEELSAFAMSTSASFNLFNRTKDSEWIINSKWEVPILNLNSIEEAATGSNLNSYKGIWHQYAEQAPFNDEGLFFSVVEPDIAIDDKESSLTGSLIDACGFNIEKQRLGEIAAKKEIQEAIVAIPFFVDNDTGEEKLLDIPLGIFEEAYQSLQKDIPVSDSLTDMIFKMNKYNLLPAHDFVRIRNKSDKPILKEEEYLPALNPFVMMIFEFGHTLQKTDLVNIWQGVMPDISVTAEKQSVTMNIPIGDKELFSVPIFNKAGLDGVLPSNLRWKIYKAKFKAANNYYDMIESKFNIDTEDRNIDHSYNWPYDFFSLVEMGKMETKFNYVNEQTGSTR